MNLVKFSIALFAIVIVCGCKKQPQFIHNEGYVFGTTYHFTYKSDVDLQQKIVLKLRQYDMSLSTFNQKSIISRINRNDSVEVDTFFTTVFLRAKEINALTNGAYDLTVAPIINAWGFGFAKADSVTPHLIDSLLQFVGMDKVQLVGKRVVKSDPRVQLEACSLAEGYGVDVVAQLLDSAGVTDYMVEIGGEVHVKGHNPKDDLWHIAVDKPIEGSDETTRQTQLVLAITDCAVSTSGSYRKFYYKDGKRLSHTIDPTTGYPISHNMLSVTIVGPNTITTDAMSTSMMVLGVEKASQLVDSLPDIEGYFIYEDSLGVMQEKMSSGFSKLVLE